MEKRFIITTTNNIEGRKILKYIDAICVNIVLGTNILSDFVAGLSDIFGGHSGTYKSKLERIYSEAKKELQEKAKSLGANGIVGFSVDFDEISGQGKSMFMISASGTACVIEEKKDLDLDLSSKDVASGSIVTLELKKKEVILRITNGEPIEGELSDFLLNYPLPEAAKFVFKKYVEIYSFNTDFVHFTYRYFTSLPIEFATSFLYSEYVPNNFNAVRTLIINCKLFSPSETLKLFDRFSHDNIINILLADKKNYNLEDLKQMKQIYEKFNNLPDIGKIEIVKGGMFSKDKEMFVCQNGHANDKDKEFCSYCGVNIKGITKEQLYTINLFKEKIDILQSLLNK